MAIEQAGYQWGTIGTADGAGTTVVTAYAANLIGVIIPGTYIGTMTFHDASAAAGTTAKSGIVTFGIPNTAVAGFIPIQARCRFGITYQATGSPVMTYLWEGL
jgi:hypothetical protein